MKRLGGRGLARILILLLWLALPGSGEAAGGRQYNRVVSLVEDAAGNLAVVNTSQAMPLSRPAVQYLPGPNGETVLAADFPGLVWSEPARQITPAAGGIVSVHFGQLQVNPPVTRIAIGTYQPRLLRDVSFRASPGALIVKWRASVPARRAGARARGKGQVARVASPASSTDIGLGPDRQAQKDGGNSRYRSGSGQPAPGQGQLAWIGSSGSLTDIGLAYSRRVGQDVGESGPGSKTGDIASVSKNQPADKEGRIPEGGQPARTGTRTAPLPGPVQPGLPAVRAVARPPANQADGRQPAATTSPGAAPEKQAGRWRRALRHLFGRPEQSSPVPAGQAAQPGAAVAPVARATTACRAATALPAGAREPVGNIDPNRAALPEPGADSPAAAGLPRLSVTAGDSFRLGLVGVRPLAYRSFRLHDPERYVVDLESAGALANLPAPDVAPGPYVRSLRVGNPDGDKQIARLVLDLASSEVTVRESPAPDRLALTVVVGGEPAVQIPLRVPPGTKIVLDAGHGGSDPGAQRGDIAEKELTLGIADRLKKILEAGGARVIMTRADDSAVSLEERVALTNSVNPDLFLSVHINSLESDSEIHGIETYYQTEASRELARQVHQSLVARLKAPDRSVRKARFYVINHTSVPAVLAEVGFISNKEERGKLISSDYQDEVAGALAQGVILYLSRRDDLAAVKDRSGTHGLPKQSETVGAAGGPSLAAATARTARRTQAREGSTN